MELNESQKRDLIARFMPILLVSTSDIGVPVDPEKYVSKCALWHGRRPGLDDKAQWGVASPSSEREPTVPRGGVTLGALPLAEMHHAAERGTDEFWLAAGDWIGSSNVGPTSDNRQANLAALRSMFSDNGGPTLRAEVCDSTSWADLSNLGIAGSKLALAEPAWSTTMERHVLINFHMLFAGHEAEPEEVFSDGVRYGSHNYEGDWVCFSVLLSAPTTEPYFEQLQPRYGLFERRFRGLSASFGEARTFRGFEPCAWSDLQRVGSQPLVLVATGTHNLYPADVATTPAGSVQTLGALSGLIDNVTDDTSKWVGKMVKKNTHTAAAVLGVTLAKMAAGAKIAGPWGMLGGLVAGIAEAAPIAEAIGKDPGSPDIDPSTSNPPAGKLKDPRDKLKDEGAEKQSYQVVSSGPVNAAEIASKLTFEAEISALLLWGHKSFEPIDRSVERFWPTHAGNVPKGYTGRWGVRCEHDPSHQRAGDILPDYRTDVPRNILHLLSGL